MDDALAAAAAPLGGSWAPPPAKKHKAKKHKKKAGKKRRRDDVDGSCIAARALAGGFVRESGLLPPEAAAAAADLVRQAPEEAWRRSSAKADAKAHGKKTNTTRHSYAVGDGGVDAPDADVEALLERVLESVAPSEWLRARRLVPRLQLGRYGRGDHIVRNFGAWPIFSARSTASSIASSSAFSTTSARRRRVPHLSEMKTAGPGVAPSAGLSMSELQLAERATGIARDLDEYLSREL